MNEKKFNFWQKWMTYVNVMTVFLGIFIAFFGESFLFEFYNNKTNDIFFNGADLSPEVSNLKNWLFGIIGGTLAGYHLLMVMISENSFKNKEVWAYKAMSYALLFWFIIDTSISTYYGAIHNVVIINIVALILIGLPLIMTRKAFIK